VLVLHAKLLANVHKSSQAVNIILSFLVDCFVNLQSLIEKVHASIATGNHEVPLDFLGLDLVSALKVDNSFLKHVLLGVMHAQARDDIDFGRVVAVRFLIEVHSLEFILL